MWGEQGEQMEGTALVRWEEGYDEPICVVCDLLPKQAKVGWYQMRFWIEDEYKDGKRGWLHWEQTKMTKPERASRLWVILAIVLQKAILLGGRLEDEEEQAKRRRSKRGGGPKRRRGRPLKPESRPRGREQSVLLRGMMAWRAAESGGKRVLPEGEVRAQPLPSRWYAVRRKPKSYQVKKQGREEKRRNQQRAQSRERREQRAQVRAAQQTEQQARRQEKQVRREAKQAAEQARRQEKQAALLAHQQGKKRMKRRPCVQQGLLGAPQNEAVLGSQGSPTNSLGLLPARSIQAGVEHHFPAVEEMTSLVSQGRSGEPGATTDMPLLQLSKGQLRPPHRLVRKEIHQKGDHGPAHQASP
jgi:hypothetical protein